MLTNGLIWQPLSLAATHVGNMSASNDLFEVKKLLEMALQNNGFYKILERLLSPKA